MTTIMSNSNHHCLPIPPYYPATPYDNLQPLPPLPETSQRKRPKYTRSKTGCLTCRVKKIKCDETKPSCMRCTHGSRECTWPDGVPPRRKGAAKRDSIDGGRPSRAGSSGLSDASPTPSTREHSPRRPQLDMNTALPLPLRSSSDNFVHLQEMIPDHSSTHRHPERGSAYMPQSSNPNMLSMIPESSYSRYDTYLHQPHQSHQSHQPHSSQSSRHTMSGSYRTLSHQPTSQSNQWNPPPEMLTPYYHNGGHERTVLHSLQQYDPSNNRYQ